MGRPEAEPSGTCGKHESRNEPAVGLVQTLRHGGCAGVLCVGVQMCGRPACADGLGM